MPCLPASHRASVGMPAPAGRSLSQSCGQMCASIRVADCRCKKIRKKTAHLTALCPSCCCCCFPWCLCWWCSPACLPFMPCTVYLRSATNSPKFYACVLSNSNLSSSDTANSHRCVGYCFTPRDSHAYIGAHNPRHWQLCGVVRRALSSDLLAAKSIVSDVLLFCTSIQDLKRKLPLVMGGWQATHSHAAASQVERPGQHQSTVPSAAPPPIRLCTVNALRHQLWRPVCRSSQAHLVVEPRPKRYAATRGTTPRRQHCSNLQNSSGSQKAS